MDIDNVKERSYGIEAVRYTRATLEGSAAHMFLGPYDYALRTAPDVDECNENETCIVPSSRNTDELGKCNIHTGLCIGHVGRLEGHPILLGSMASSDPKKQSTSSLSRQLFISGSISDLEMRSMYAKEMRTNNGILRKVVTRMVPERSHCPGPQLTGS